jgi:hypothetical protein
MNSNSSLALVGFLQLERHSQHPVQALFFSLFSEDSLAPLNRSAQIAQRQDPKISRLWPNLGTSILGNLFFGQDYFMAGSITEFLAMSAEDIGALVPGALVDGVSPRIRQDRS